MTGSALADLDADALRRWCRDSCAALQSARAAIDGLNVFPVADADTGTNLALTLEAGTAALDLPPTGVETAATVAHAVAAAALRGARGNSGVIVSQYLLGFADALPEGAAVDGRVLVSALARAADAAYAAVAQPIEGTILTVARAAAVAAARVAPPQLLAVTDAAAVGARAALANTPGQLPALAAAGVVDAGGQGLVLLLDQLVDVVAGRPGTRAPVLTVPSHATGHRGSSIGDPGAFAYEVQYLLDAPADALPGLRDRLAMIGDSVAVGGDDIYNVHVHVDDVGAAIEAGIDAGRPHHIRVSRFADQLPPRRPAGAAVVALCTSPTTTDLFRAAGASVLDAAGDAAASVQALTDTLLGLGVAQVAILPNARDSRALADEAAARVRTRGCAATVIPTRSPLQGLAAIAVHDPTRRFDDDVVAMSTAAAATRYGAVARAEHDALTSAGRCRRGDLLGLIDDDVAVVGTDIDVVARDLVDRLLVGGGELVTILAAGTSATEVADRLVDYVTATRPAVETVIHPGTAADDALLIGVE